MAFLFKVNDLKCLLLHLLFHFPSPLGFHLLLSMGPKLKSLGTVEQFNGTQPRFKLQTSSS